MSFNEEKVGFGIIGAGAIAPFHAEAINDLPEAELVGVCDSVEERAKNLADKFGARMWCTDYRKLLERNDIDVVNLCLPPSLNEEITLAAAQRGIHVIVEKPMALNVAQADNMISACRRAKTKLAVILPSRFSEDTQQVKKLVDEGKFGRLFMGNAFTNWFRTREYYASASWRKTWAGQGGGALINQGIHAVDLLQWYMGPVESVYGVIDTFVHDIEVEDTAVAILKFKSGALGIIQGTTAAYPGFPRKIEIFGEKGSAVLKVKSLELLAIIGTKIKIKGTLEQDYINKRPGDCSSGPVHLTSEQHRLQIKDFIQAIKDNREPFVNGEEGKKSLEIIKAIYASSKAKKEVKLPLKEKME